MNYDADTNAKLLGVFPMIADAWRHVAEDFWTDHKIQIRITTGMRSFTDQLQVWAQGRTKDNDGAWTITDIRKVVSYSRPGQSYHQYGLSLDTCFVGSDPYLEKIDPKDSEMLWNAYGSLCKKYGLQWGGEFKHPDRPHCENSYGLSVRECLNIYNENGGVKGVWQKCYTIALCGRESEPL